MQPNPSPDVRQPAHRPATMMADWTEITDDNVELLTSLVVGRRIVGIEREPDTGEDFPQGANGVELVLDDGSRLSFDGWGYDGWGLTTHYAPPGVTVTRAAADTPADETHPTTPPPQAPCADL